MIIHWSSTVCEFIYVYSDVMKTRNEEKSHEFKTDFQYTDKVVIILQSKLNV